MNNELQKADYPKYSNQLTKRNNIIGSWVQSEDDNAIAKTYLDKKIGDFDREDMKLLVEVMAQWRVLLGVTSDSTENELIIICQFLYDNFKKYTLADIKLAMNWTISGKLDVGYVSQKTISSYYISRALNAYDEYKRNIYNNMMQRRDNYLNRVEMEQKPELTADDKANNFKNLILGLYDSFQKGNFFVDFGDFVYNWLKKTNQITNDKAVIAAAVKYGKEQFIEQRRNENIQRLVKAIEPESREFREKKLARHYIITIYFKENTIQSIINKINPSQFI
jgi:hypothetical protein